MRHPDEGEIHAWLDGALDPATAAGFEAHVAACPPCAAAVAEARGLIAGASRILLGLDSVPSGVIPAVPDASGQSAARMAPSRRQIPWFARRPVQIAAGLMLVAGIGGVAVQRSLRSGDQVFIQFETDAAPATRGPAAGGSAPSSESGALIGEVREQATSSLPPAAAPTAPVATSMPRAGKAVADAFGRRADERSAAGSTLGGVANSVAAPEGRSASRQADDLAQRVPAPVMGSSAVLPSPAPPAAVAPAFATATPSATFPAPKVPSVLLADSTASSLPRGLADMRLKRKETGGSGTITGKVIATDDSPLQSATVMVASANIAVTTAADGSFTLPPLPAGTYTVEARRIGYASARLEGLQVTGGDTAYTRLALKPSSAQLQAVVVTGAGSPVKSPSVGGACIALNVDAGDDTQGIPLLPRRVRIRLADRAITGDFAVDAVRGARSLAPAPQAAAQARSTIASASETAAPLAWEPIAADSIGVTWATDTDVVTLILGIHGSAVSGTAMSSQSIPARTARVTGSRVACTGG